MGLTTPCLRVQVSRHSWLTKNGLKFHRTTRVSYYVHYKVSGGIKIAVCQCSWTFKEGSGPREHVDFKWSTTVEKRAYLEPTFKRGAFFSPDLSSPWRRQSLLVKRLASKTFLVRPVLTHYTCCIDLKTQLCSKTFFFTIDLLSNNTLRFS